MPEIDPSLPTTRSVLCFHGDGTLRRAAEPVPEVAPGTVLVAVRASLVSPGSELGGWEALKRLRQQPEDRPPKRIGYSNAGIVLSVGEGVTRLLPGQRVACVGAGYALHTDFAVVPQNLVVPLPDSLSFEDATYAMLLATALQALRRTEPAFGDWVAVAALGLVGLLTARFFQLAGCRVIGWDTQEARLAHARQLGISETVQVGREDPVARTRAFTCGEGLDHGLIALGGDAERPFRALMDCLKVTPDGHPMGNIVIVGGAEFPYHKNLTNVNLLRSSRTGPGYHDADWEHGADYPPVHVRWHTRNNIALCLEKAAAGEIAVSALTTHVIPFAEAETRSEAALEDPSGILGMVFTMENRENP